MSTTTKQTPRTSTIPYTPTSPGWSSMHPRPLGPINPHPDLNRTETPALPSPLRDTIFHTTTHGVYRLSTHVVPAAFPRLALDIPLPKIPAYTLGAPPSERHDKINMLAKQVLERQYAYEGGHFGGKQSEKLLWNCVNRYARTPGRSTAGETGVTLLLVHANGFHKETWETMVRSLLDAPAGHMIDEVWAWEAVQHGDAAVMNAENLGGMFDWLDNSRDIANFLMRYLPEEVETAVLPTRLPRVPQWVTNFRGERGYRTRKLIVVGHSFGGCTSLRVAVDFPKLFSSFVLVDPVISRPQVRQLRRLHQAVSNAFARRDHWPSRQEALRLLQKSPFFGVWKPSVLQLYLDHGLIDDSEGGVRLKMPGLQEGLLFANQTPAWEMWELLERLDERITLRWIIPGGLHQSPTKNGTYERVWRRPVNSSNIMFHFAGHLIVQEAPCELAQDISDFVMRKYGSCKAHL